MNRVTMLLAILATTTLPVVASGQGVSPTPALESGDHAAVPADAFTFEPLEVPGFDRP